MASAVTKLESCELPHTLTEPFIMHRVRARLLQAYFTSAASDMYLPDLVALPPISLRRRIFANLIQALPNVATVFRYSQSLLELIPFASLADVLQLPSKEAGRRLEAIQKHLQREVQSVPASKLSLMTISTQALVDLVTEYFPFHSKAARSLLSFKAVGDHAGWSITQILASSSREEWPTILNAAGIEAGECLDRIVQVKRECCDFCSLLKLGSRFQSCFDAMFSGCYVFQDSPFDILRHGPQVPTSGRLFFDWNQMQSLQIQDYCR